MGNNWSINDNKPALAEKYEWRVPEIDQEHVEETTAPGDLKIKPKDISLIPTNSPKQSGIQSGQSDWSFDSGVDPDWYILGEIVQES